MALASEIIRRALREGQIIAISGSPTAAETAEALSLLNTVVQSVMGSEVGQSLTDLTIGGEYDQSNAIGSYVPENVRLVLNLGAAVTYRMHPRPYEGQRFAIADAGANLATYNVTLDGNGRRIEAAATVTLSTSGLARQWFYHTGNWHRISDLLAANEMPFPSEFDDYFTTALAMRLNPRHRSDGMSAESLAVFQRQESQLQARFSKPRGVQDWGSLGLLGQYGRNLGGQELL